MVNPIPPIQSTPPLTPPPAVTEPERIATEGEGGYGRPPSYPPTQPAASLQPQKGTENESEPRGLDFSALLAALRSVVEQENVELEFTVDEATQKLVLRVLDAETKQVLQQIPPEIALRIARFVMELLQRNGGIADVRA
jgi:flagellar protein FlaG